MTDSHPNPGADGPGPEPGTPGPTGPGQQPLPGAADEQPPPGPTDLPPAGEADTDLAWDLPESDRAYVMASLARISGDQAEVSARLRVAEDRIEDLAAGFDGIEDAATATVTSDQIPDRTHDGADDGDPAVGGAAAPAAGEQAGHDGIDMVELVAWVRDHIALLLERKLPQTGAPPHWCRRWWMHAEAIARFEALRRGWVEAVAGDGNAMVVWFEHLDLMLAVLMGEGGTFSGCTNGEHRAGAVRMLGHDEPDAAYFADFDLLDTG